MAEAALVGAAALIVLLSVLGPLAGRTSVDAPSPMPQGLLRLLQAI
jgi:hypothetical protein